MRLMCKKMKIHGETSTREKRGGFDEVECSSRAGVDELIIPLTFSLL
jgi:hypothetical protein